ATVRFAGGGMPWWTRLPAGCGTRTSWSCPSRPISAARSTAALAARTSFATSSAEVERPLHSRIAPPAATRWSSWRVPAIASWSWARATTRFRSLPATCSAGLRRRNLFHDLVGARQQHRRYVEAQRPRRPQVDHQLVFGRRLHRQIGRLLALEDSVDVTCRA